MKKIKSVLAALLCTGIGTASASVIEFSTGFSTSGPLATALDYQQVVDAAVATASPGYGSGFLTSYDQVSNQSLYGSATNIAFKSTIDFYLAQAGLYEFRAGVDFGRGGAVFVDQLATAFKSNDMWWAGNYSNPSQYFGFSLNLAAGGHQLALYGLEGCCDGAQQVQFRGPQDQDFQSFSALDGLDPVSVPEPGSWSLAAVGLALLAVRRQRQV